MHLQSASTNFRLARFGALPPSRLSARHAIVHVVERLAPGGIETLVLDLVSGDDTGADRIFSLSGTVDTLVDSWPALAPIRHRVEAFDRSEGVRPRLVLDLSLRLAALAPVAVVVHHIGPLIYAGLAARLARVPRVLYVEHDVWHYEEGRQRTLFKIFSWLSKSRHIAVSDDIANVVRSLRPGASITVVPPGVDTRRFAPGDRTEAHLGLGLDPTWTVVGTVGRLEAVKGHAVLVQAMARLPGHVHLAIVGGGSTLDELKSVAEHLGIASRVHFLGWQDNLERIYPAFDLFCLPSLAEGLPRAVLEAQACDLRVVASEVGAMKDAVCSSTGSLVPPGDPSALADALEKALTKTGGLRPRDHVLHAFSLDLTAAAYRRIIEGA